MPKHSSVSQIRTLARCPVQYEYAYIQGLRLAPGIAAVIGGGTHASVEKNMNHKKETGELLPDDAVRDHAADGVREKVNEGGVALDEEERARGKKVVVDEAVDTAISLAVLHHEQLAPSITPLHVERAFLLEMPGLRPIKGYIDIIDAGDDCGVVRDTKSAGKTAKQEDVDRDVQLTVYGMAVHALDGPSPDGTYLLSLDQLLKTKQPSVARHLTERTVTDFRSILERFHLADQQIASGIFPPTDPSNWWCSRKWCGYFGMCPHGARARVQG